MNLKRVGGDRPKHLYESDVVIELHNRINQLRPDTEPLWGRMQPAQAFAHCALVTEYALGEFTLPRSLLGRLIGGRIKRSLLVKRNSMGKNAPTHSKVVVQDARDFEVERERLHAAIARFSAGGASACTRQPHFFFGPMTPLEWATFLYVHLDHHLRQFRV
jgi:hypothetical protein